MIQITLLPMCTFPNSLQAKFQRILLFLCWYIDFIALTWSAQTIVMEMKLMNTKLKGCTSYQYSIQFFKNAPELNKALLIVTRCLKKARSSIMRKTLRKKQDFDATKSFMPAKLKRIETFFSLKTFCLQSLYCVLTCLSFSKSFHL